MSKIQAVRLINVNYNNNAIRISDECFHFHGESTLMSLRNGGGKSVLVQMMTAPFVHKRYRDAKDRPFESYFTTGKPTFILVEWALDEGAGYVLTGMMVRKNQDGENESEEALDMINFISEYREPCEQDIHHLPVVEKGAKEMILKNYTACRQLFDSYKKDRSLKFYYYDMNNAAQSRQYFDKLMEYQIHYKEWESIIKKVNLKESGLSDLFADCRDEKGLVEKWFLDAVENKLNRDKDRMKEFQNLMEKYVAQYQDNQSKIRRRDTIRLFEEGAAKIERQALSCQEEEEKEKEQMHLLARFIEALEQLFAASGEEQQGIEEKILKIQEEIARISYEKLSSEIHTLEKTLRSHASNRDIIGEERDALERKKERTEQILHLLACAKWQETLEKEQKELEEIRQKLLVSHQKEEDLEPERRRLGGTLYRYYGHCLEENKAHRKENKKQYEERGEKVKEEKKKLSGYEESLLFEASRQGGLKSQVEFYDQQEEWYNQAFGEQLLRNILGEYEPGTLEIRRKTLEKETEECIRFRQRKRKRQESANEKKNSLERELLKLHDRQIQRKMEQEQEELVREKYEQELKDRRVVLRYLDLEEKKLFETGEILHASERKLRELESLIRNLGREEDELKKEHRQLTEGRTQELSEALEAELQALSIPVVYGMEWLKKNGLSEKQNQELVRSHPFLPYALLLSGKELQKLSRNAGEVYTSFPVPIVLREELTDVSPAEEGGVRTYPGVHFYMLFNENLLNEEKLRLLVKEKEQQIQKKQEAMARRQKEYEESYGRQELVRNQSVTKESYEKNEQTLAELFREQKELEDRAGVMQEDVRKLEEELKTLHQELQESERSLEGLRRKKEEFLRLCGAYEQYRQNRQELERCQRGIKRLEERKALSETSLESLHSQQITLAAEADRLEREAQTVQEKLLNYQMYEGEKETEAFGGEEIGVLEARYAAITGSLSRERRELEEQEKKARKRKEDAAGELEHLRLKYHLEPEAWMGTHYHRREERHQEEILEETHQEIKSVQGRWVEEEKKITALDQQKKDRYNRMKEVCQKEEPLPEQEIQDQDFDSRSKELDYQRRELEKSKNALIDRMQGYEENLAALSEYTEFALGDPVVWDVDFAGMNRKELRDYQGILLRDYRSAVREKQKAGERLTQLLNQVVRMEAFEEDFYKKPLEAMLELTDEAGQVLRQLSTTCQSYGNLMEKLEVDISLVEKEKEKIVELLEDYVREVHQNLDRIDANSTITIRERPVKMLKLTLPSWEENEGLYRLRLQDLLDEVTKKGLQILARNENVQEYFGTQLTTRNLYDAVIGIGKVQIRLFKIEEQREYPITWAQVAKNSGGEGFLSAFVILSSLLYYMRKDETDIFADRNEGKVLLMDNPFAQTNASHLLKPLMDMARKTNTQLICFTGLGGESIYNRFDNIYVLNLIAANLRSGMQYLRADHLRGKEPETMVVSQIEVVEQQELIF